MIIGAGPNYKIGDIVKLTTHQLAARRVPGQEARCRIVRAVTLEEFMRFWEVEDPEGLKQSIDRIGYPDARAYYEVEID